ncbi:hemagglutinin [Bdellovibrio bacteriovorus]|uniref:hemagglutinin n=1 Tax=Bdellovibrio bacteriovorus TaxID=959 RepID=UPI0035A570E8
MNSRNVEVTFIILCLWLSATLSGCIKADINHPDLVPTLKSTTASYYTNNSSIKVKVQFNRPPTKIVDTEFKTENATVVSITQLDHFSYLVEMTPIAEGRVILNLPEGAALDERGKKSFESENFEVYYDNSIPVTGTATILPAAVSPNPRPIIDGQTEPKAIVTLYNSITCSGDKLADTQADSVTGAFHFPLGNALTVEGAYAWSVLSEDAAGNTYCYPYPLPYVFDETEPSTPSISLPYAIQDSPVIVDVASCDDTNQVPDSYFQVAFTQDGADVPDFSDALWINCAAGNNYVPVTGAEGTHTLTMWVRDEAGNINQSNTVSFTLDTITPSLTVPTTASLNRNSSTTVLFDDSTVSSDEEGAGVYSLGTASAPRCSDYGSVSIDSSTGALTYTPTAYYYNKDGATDYNGGPCNIKVQFTDQVLPTGHLVEADVAVTVNFIDELPQITAWPGTNGTAAEKCGNKCFANAIFDLNFTANPGGAGFPDPQTLTCSATTADGYYVSVASCSVSGTTGTLSLQMGSAHASSTDTTLITLTVSDGVTTVSKSFGVHVDNYVMSMYPALAVSRPLSCILCHANIQADIVMDFGISQANYTNANNILGFARINSSHMYHADNNVIGFTVTGSLYMPDITVTDKNFIKQVSGTPNGPAVNLRSFLLNPWNYYEPEADAQGTLLTDTDGFVKVAAAPTAMAAMPPINGGITLKNSVKIRAPSDAEILALDSSLSASDTEFVYKGPNSKPGLSGLEIHDYGYGDFVRNNGTIVCYGSIIISGTLYLKNPDIQTDDVGCSIYVAGNVFIETNRGTAINYVGGAASPTLQITSSRNLHMGIGLYDLAHIRNSNNAANDARKIVNDANPSGLRDAGGTVASIKSNEDAGAWEYMTCPLRPEHAIYLDTHYVSNGNYTACDASVDPWKCAMAKEIFNNWTGVVTNYNYVPNVRNVYRPATNTLIDIVRAYESMCRVNGAYQMTNFNNYSWTWAGYWGEQPSKIGAPTINSFRVSTVFDHLRVNAHNVHSRYYGEFRGSVISPYALFAVGNLVFRYDTRLNSVVPYPKLMVPNPIFDVQ